MMSDKKPPDDLIGQTIAGRYRIISRLGAGGMGVAYRAWDEQEGRPVVIKIPKKNFLEDPKFAERFAREIRLLQGLTHPHIVPIVDVGEHEGLPYVAMRFLPGGSLSNRRLRDENGKTRPNPPGMLHLWLPAVADALDHVHANGVVHRDVKPGNIFFDAFWGAFLGDFGIAKIVEESDSFDRENTLTATNMGIGTQEYMGPEQFTPKPVLDGRTDQYALAVMVYEMVSGTRPFTGTTAHLIVEVTTQPVPRLTSPQWSLPPSLVRAVEAGLSKEPGQRFRTCTEFATAVLADVSRLEDERGIARLLCPGCGRILKLPVQAAGHQGSCPRCKSRMAVAADLGALWLVDEDRRAAKAVGGPPVVVDGPLPAEPVSDFKVISDSVRVTTGKRTRRARKSRTSSAPLIGVLAGLGLVVAALGWAVLPGPAPRPEPTLKTAHKQTATADPGPGASDGLAKKGPPPDTLSPDSNTKPNPDPETASHPLADAVQRTEQFTDTAFDAADRNPTGLADSSEPRMEPRPEVPDLPEIPEPPLTPPTTARSLAATAVGQMLRFEPLQNSVGMRLKLLPPGQFVMGDPDGRPDDKPHQVTLTQPFFIGIHEVTNGQWSTVMGSKPPSRWSNWDGPVEQVSWLDANRFCEALSAREEERAAGRRYRLPTSAEWEYACRAGSATTYYFGADSQDLPDHAWYDSTASDRTRSVGQKLPNAWGLYDMYGNVWEWCADYRGPYGAAEVDPTGPRAGDQRVLRGGCWGSGPEYCTSAARLGLFQLKAKEGIGFRVVLELIDVPPNVAASDVQPVAAGEPQPGPATLESLLSAEPSGNRRAPALTSGAAAKADTSKSAIERALAWLVSHQLPDGGWSFDLHACPRCRGACGDSGASRKADRTGATALALLPFLGQGYTHRAGDYKRVVEGGIGFLVQRAIQGNGKAYDASGNMYSQGLTGIVLAECYAMSKDSRLAAPTQSVIDFIAQAQDPNGGGWRYSPKQPGDTSAFGWQIFALKSANKARVKVNPLTVKKAVKFLDFVQSDSGAAYGYLDQSSPAAARSAIGLLCRLELGWKPDHPAVQRGAERIAEQGPSKDLYHNYYATRLISEVGEPLWPTWGNRMKALLLTAQSQAGHESGSWHAGVEAGHGAHAAGRLYCTALAVRTLQICNGTPPIEPPVAGAPGARDEADAR